MRVLNRQAQGRRPYMEDRWCNVQIGKRIQCVGIFDGHGGSSIAELCAANFPLVIKQGLHELGITNVGYILNRSFHVMDELAKGCQSPHVGSTAIVALVLESSIWFANAGDSMGMVVYSSGEAELVSFEHKVENEKERIQSEGGRITYDDGCARVERTLNVSRSIGDFHMKRHVPPTPYIRSISMNFKEIKYVFMASDGVWDVFDIHGIASIIANVADINDALDNILIQSISRGSDNVTMTYLDFAASAQGRRG